MPDLPARTEQAIAVLDDGWWLTASGEVWLKTTPANGSDSCWQQGIGRGLAHHKAMAAKGGIVARLVLESELTALRERLEEADELLREALSFALQGGGGRTADFRARASAFLTYQGDTTSD